MCEAKAPDEVRRKNESGRKCGEGIKCSASRVLFEEPFDSAHFIARVKNTTSINGQWEWRSKANGEVPPPDMCPLKIHKTGGIFVIFL